MANMSKAIMIKGGSLAHPATKLVFQWLATLDASYLESWSKILASADPKDPLTKLCQDTMSNLLTDKPIDGLDLLCLAWVMRNGRPGLTKLELEIPESLGRNLLELAEVHTNGDPARFVLELLEREVDPDAWKQRQLAKTRAKLNS